MDKELHALTAEIYLGHNLRVENNRRQMPLEVALDLAKYYLERRLIDGKKIPNCNMAQA
jgi:DNA polymerase IIIc chi subunit